MAKYLPGPVTGEVRGSIGGTTFSRNRYGAYMRNRAKPVVSMTEKAVNAKSRMTAATQAWQDLTIPEQRTWNGWANSNPITGALGETQYLTGHAAFVGNYCRMLLRGLATLTNPPVTPAEPPLISGSVVADKTGGTCLISFTPTPLAGTGSLWIRGCYVSSAGKHYVENLYRYCQGSPVAPASPYDAFGQIEVELGVMVIGHRLILMVYNFDTVTGLLSAPRRFEDTII